MILAASFLLGFFGWSVGVITGFGICHEGNNGEKRSLALKLLVLSFALIVIALLLASNS